MIRWYYYVFRKVYIICSIIEGEILIYFENNYSNFILNYLPMNARMNERLKEIESSVQ